MKNDLLDLKMTPSDFEGSSDEWDMVDPVIK